MTSIVTLTYNEPAGGTPGDQSRDGSAYILPRIFNPGMTDDAGTYVCRADIQVSGSSLTILVFDNLQITSNEYTSKWY